MLIDLANNLKNEDKVLEEISSKVDERFGTDKMFITEDLIMILKELEINKKLISVLLLFLIHNEFILKSLIDSIVPILKDKFPYLNINIKDALNSTIELEKFVDKPNNIALKIDNYIELTWDIVDDDFILEKQPVEDIIKNIYEKDKNKISKKKEKKRLKKRKN